MQNKEAKNKVEFKSDQHGQHDHSFNFWRGCHKFSEGCQNCYMYIAQTRRGINPSEVMLCTTTWKEPPRWQREVERTGKPQSVFACSYGDFFIEDADPWRDDAWKLIKETPNLTWELQSKRTHLIKDRLPADWDQGYPNVWLGTAVELKKYFHRLDELRDIPCVLRYVDLAPMLEDLMPELEDHIDGFGWVIVSGETGCNSVEPRPFDEQWGRNVRDLCKSRGIPFFFSHTRGYERFPSEYLDGRKHKEVPPLTTGL